MPEGADHKLRVFSLYESVRLALADRALVASDMFLYWDPTDPKSCLAPDLAVRVGSPPALLRTWKTWEHGAPHVGVEIVSEWDRRRQPFARQLERYRRAGIAEVVRFDVEDVECPIRSWDLLDGDLVERDPSAPDARYCDALGLLWCIVEDAELGPSLRLARLGNCEDLLPTPSEERDAARAAEKAERLAKEAASARIAELEVELARRR